MSGPMLFASEQDVSRALESSFIRVQQRMQGIPFLNPRIQVKAVGFQPWQDFWLGVVVTPWFMNLMLLPRNEKPVLPGYGNTRTFSFPCGEFSFIGGFEESIGSYLSCSLLSPLQEMQSQELAEQVAEVSLQQLFSAGQSEADQSEAGQSEDKQPHNDLEPPRRALFRRLMGQSKDLVPGNRGV